MPKKSTSAKVRKLPASKTEPTSNDYGDEIGAFIEECRERVVKTNRGPLTTSEMANARPSTVIKRPAVRKADDDGTDIAGREIEVKKMEAELNKREVALIERELKLLSLQQEVDRLRPLSGLHRVVTAMATERKLESLLEVITRETRDMIGCDRCSVFVLDANRDQLWTKITQGHENNRLVHIPIVANTIASLTARTGEIVNIEDAYGDNRFNPELDKITGYLTLNVLCVPMRNRNGEVIGVFEVLNKKGGSFTELDEESLQGLAAVAAGLIEQAQSYEEIEHFVDKTLETLARTIDKRDPLTAGHSMRVTKYSLLMGEELGVTEKEMDVLRYAALMHDFGKIGVPEAILWKNGRLTAEEYKVVQKHAKITYDLLSNLPFTRRLADVPFVASCHHEKVDGSGYYRGLKGEEIPYLTRIITVADVFDALTSVRHYRNRMEITKVTQILNSGRNQHFDGDVVDAFFNLDSAQVMRVMESERGQDLPRELDLFRSTSWQRMMDVLDGADCNEREAGLKDIFLRVYNAELPLDYQPLD